MEFYSSQQHYTSCLALKIHSLQFYLPLPRLHQSCFKNFNHLLFVACSLVSFCLPCSFLSQPCSPLSISRWYSHLNGENRARKNKHRDARTRGGKNTKHWWVLNTNPCTDVLVRTQTHTHRGVYKHIFSTSAHTYTQMHTLLGISGPLGAGWIEYICTSGLNSEDYGGYEGNA